MSIRKLVQHQQNTYGHFHQHQGNFLIHLIMVPVFIIGFWGALVSLVLGKFLMAGGLVLLPLISIAVQGIGHKKEHLPPEPFTSPVNAVTRILLEQLYTFPKYLISGKWKKKRQ
ncbi:conserved hypothetical protein [Vibrio nigripulchritudo MADA3029]|uniref:hypothetical protein n=1 Tax=Vibrio nigripulchritudo TaxID=28173 RepID=UPI0003B2155B|nr:hypothetical protein [Vibrio nigripulchritudo]CCN47495.1 conserved hypothetical protein [Vibrio nigripulchritudo MADA3020]CCN55903.1 conserved hypothetical protein [Vibrio nigripulchritudo MADA3021]CCN57126.1 conserved hypothetical protein [Vibrio nigripulchritudo MADA3029]